MSKRNLGSVFLGDRVQHLPQHLLNMPMSPPPGTESHSTTLAPPSEPSLDGQTDDAASESYEETGEDGDGGDELGEEGGEELGEEDRDGLGEEGEEVEGEEVELDVTSAEEDEPDTATLDDPTVVIGPNVDSLLAPNPVPVSPELMLELRLRWLEALVLGIGKDGNVVPPREQDATGTLVRKANDAQRALDDSVKMNDGLRKFMSVYNQNAHLLTPAFAHGLVPTPDTVSVSDLEALMLESEAEIRAADRDLREIAELESRGVLDAGKLPGHEPLQPRVDALIQAHLEDIALFDSLEERISKLITNYSSHVNGLSELFVEWDAVLNKAEVLTTRREKERERAKETSFD
ncbi:hypothetical protein BDV93DRAFT_545121 [Ceratobasidium sp. AG-I]|nr:hypothetical protein BDV93DRAFT_545121 [Ceratobasidium sp. AG-I]